MSASVDYAVLYTDVLPTTPIRLGQLVVDESEADPADMLKYCSSLSPVTYTSVIGGGGGQVDSVVAGTMISVNSADPVNPIVSLAPGGTTAQVVLGDATLGTLPVGANPTGTIGLAAVNGSATTFLRSDGAPALSQAIAPTWTGQHIFASSSSPQIEIEDDAPQLLFDETDATTDERYYRVRTNGGQFIIDLVNDALGDNKQAFNINRTANAPSSITLGNSTDLPQLNLDIDDLHINGDPGTATYVLTSNGSNNPPTWEPVPVGGRSISTHCIVEEDFIVTPNTTGSAGWDSAATGGGGQQGAFVAGHPGISQLTTGTGSGDAAGIGYSGNITAAAASGWRIGDGEITFDCVFRFQSGVIGNTTATNGFLRIGMVDEISGAPSEGLYLTTDGVDSGGIYAAEFLAASRNTASGLVYWQDTAIAINVGTWYHFTMVVNAAGTSVDYYIDGVLFATATTNLPTGVALTPAAQIARAAAIGTSYVVQVDYISVVQELTTPR